MFVFLIKKIKSQQSCIKDMLLKEVELTSCLPTLYQDREGPLVIGLGEAMRKRLVQCQRIKVFIFIGSAFIFL